ncbi:hypothetical protein GCM10022221_18320 [Actinocorallia aurea]
MVVEEAPPVGGGAWKVGVPGRRAPVAGAGNRGQPQLPQDMRPPPAPMVLLGLVTEPQYMTHLPAAEP